jgi:hypothetical protein
VSTHKRRDDWLDNDEYPDERDIDDFGDDSPLDNDPLSIGYVPKLHVPFWTRGRILLALVLLILLLAFIFAEVSPLLSH